MIKACLHNVLFAAVILLAGCASGTVAGQTWEKNFGKNSRDRILACEKVKGGYLVAGYAVSKRTHEDIMVMKLDFAGNFLWGRRYGGREYDRGYSLAVSDYGFVVVGVTDTGNRGARDIWVLGLDREGDIVWNKIIGGFKEDYGFSVKRLSEGFIIAGTTASFNVRGQQAWVIRLDKEGKILWDKKYGINKINYCYDVDRAEEGFVLTGSTLNGNNHDLFVIMIDEFGERLWEKVYGGSGNEFGRSVKRVEDGFVVAGSTSSKGSGGSDAWVLRLNEKGSILWERSFGRGGSDSAERIAVSGEDFIFAGYSLGRSISFGGQAWIFKLDKKGVLLWSRMFENASYAAGVVVEKNGYFVTGSLVNPVDKKMGLWAARLNKNGLIEK